MSPGAQRNVFLSLGSNLGDRGAYLAAARDALAALPGTSLVAASRIYETAPQGYDEQPEFLNQVVLLHTGLQPRDLLTECQRVEKEHGRLHDLRFGPRTLDIDILLFEGVESDHLELTLPHPRMMRRAFVLIPLAEVWSAGVGMPELDVAALAQAAARDQAVQLFDDAEA